MDFTKLDQKRRLLVIASTVPTRKIVPFLSLVVLTGILAVVLYEWDVNHVVMDVKDQDELFVTTEKRIFMQERELEWGLVLEDNPTQIKEMKSDFKNQVKYQNLLDADLIVQDIEPKRAEITKKDVATGERTSPQSITFVDAMSRFTTRTEQTQVTIPNGNHSNSHPVPNLKTKPVEDNMLSARETEGREHIWENYIEQSTPTIVDQLEVPVIERRNDKKYDTVSAIKCIHDQMNDFFKSLERYRAQMLLVAKWKNWEVDKMVTVDAREKGDFLEEMAQFPSVKVFKIHIPLTALRGCVQNEFYYHYSISNNQCQRAVNQSMFHTRNGLEVYNLSCTNNLETTLRSSPLSPYALDVGLPLNYRLGSGGDTASFFSVFQSGVVTSEGDVISGNIKHIIQRCHDKRFEEPVPLTVDQNKYPLYDELFSIAVMWGAAFYHSNIDALGRLVPYISFLRKHPTIKIHSTWVWPKFAEKFLSGEGLSPDRFVHGIARGKLVYVPASFLCHRPSFFSAHLLGLYMKASLPNDPKTRNAIIVIRRTPQVKPHLRPRHFLNHDLIMTTLKKFTDRLNLTLWEFRDDPVPDAHQTARMFNRALIVIAPHGAGEVNLVFSQPRTVLIEGMCIREFKAFSMAFRNLVHLQGGIYHGLYNDKQHCEDITPNEILEPTIFFLRSFGYLLS